MLTELFIGIKKRNQPLKCTIGCKDGQWTCVCYNGKAAIRIMRSSTLLECTENLAHFLLETYEKITYVESKVPANLITGILRKNLNLIDSIDVPGFYLN